MFKREGCFCGPHPQFCQLPIRTMDQDDAAGFRAGEWLPGGPLLWPLLGPALLLRVRSTSNTDMDQEEMVQETVELPSSAASHVVLRTYLWDLAKSDPLEHKLLGRTENFIVANAFLVPSIPVCALWMVCLDDRLWNKEGGCFLIINGLLARNISATLFLSENVAKCLKIYVNLLT